MATPGLVRRESAADSGEIVWADATSDAMDAAFVIADEPEPQAKQFPPPPQPQYQHSPAKRARKGPPPVDLLALLLVIGSHAAGAWLILPEVWDSALVVTFVYLSGVVAMWLALATRWSDPGFLPAGSAAALLAAEPSPPCGSALTRPEALYWRQRALYGLMPAPLPGLAPAAPSADRRAAICGARTDGDPPAAVCESCRLHKPLRASHCSVSGRCVARMDHFCVWLGCPVGAGNHRLFVAFVCAAAFHLGVCTLAAGYALSKHLAQGDSAFLLLGDSLLVLIGAGFTLFVALLAGAQAVNVAVDVTGRERIRGLAGGGRGADERASKWAAHWAKTSWRLLDNTARFWAGAV
ncbi:hypothetical protein FNF27_04279 [Cafeteria roenbergensis]|uniref:Palmitoyltransferase n=1 Tax=Cafeteria roenbergensis TaxID=33653 RepID=A0A5A8EBZ2_CAFRO|nr:hypothetical protein FNF27_04279 [Cafeteria roenbergensis]